MAAERDARKPDAMTVDSALRKPPTGISRALFRAPVALYRCRLGWLMGDRLILIEHRGRRTGLTRRTLVEVVERRVDDDSYVVAAGFGARSQWYRNLWANPRAVVQVGRRRLAVEASTVAPAEGGDVMARYAARHPRTARRLCRFMGLSAAGDDYRAVGERLPFLRLSAVEQPSSPAPDPARQTRTVRLPDGRTVAYTEWGDPAGFPTFYFHGTPGRSLEGAFADHAASRHGLRRLAPDRPGYGLSTFQPLRRFHDWPADVSAIADALGIDAFGVVGHSGGGPHAFACGAALSPDRLRFVGLLGPWGPVASARIRTHLTRLDRRCTMLARRSQWVMRAAFAPLALFARYAPGLFLAALRASVPPTDRAALGGDRIGGHLKLSIGEA
jgi:deazaflavin-dependent oxidoreductase (nitroreductase family)